MGYRAHVSKKRVVEYGEGVFNHCTQALSDFIYSLKDEMETDYSPFCIDDEWGGIKEEWEIEREWLEKAIEYMKENKNLKDIAFNDYTYGDIITNFEYWLDQSNNKENFSDSYFVYLTWF